MTFVPHWTNNKEKMCYWCQKCRKECSGNPDLGLTDVCAGFEGQVKK